MNVLSFLTVKKWNRKESVCDKNNEEKDFHAALLLKLLDGDIPIERTEQEESKESKKFLGNFFSLDINIKI